MTAVGMRLEALKTRVDDDQAKRELQRAHDTVVLAVERMRKLLFDLCPPALDREGLGPALRQYLEQVRAEGGPTYRLRDRLRRTPPRDTGILLHRLAREALMNVRKHADASTVEVSLEDRDGGVAIRISDDGVGLRPEDAHRPRPGHLGIVSMRRRVEGAGGRLRIRSRPGAGTTVEAWLPSRTSTA